MIKLDIRNKIKTKQIFKEILRRRKKISSRLYQMKAGTFWFKHVNRTKKLIPQHSSIALCNARKLSMRPNNKPPVNRF